MCCSDDRPGKRDAESPLPMQPPAIPLLAVRYALPPHSFRASVRKPAQDSSPPTSCACHGMDDRSEEHTSELQSLMRISYAVFCLKNKNTVHYNKLKRYIKFSTNSKYIKYNLN